MMADLQSMFLNAANLHKTGRIKEAEAGYDEILAAWPACHEAMFMKGAIALESSRYAESEAHFRRALVHDEGNPEYLFRLGQSLMKQQRLDDAVETFRLAASEADDYAPLYGLLGDCLLNLRRPKDAEQAYRRVIAIEPDNLSAWRGLAASLKTQRRRFREAVDACRRMEEIVPTSAEGPALASTILERVNEPEEAHQMAARALAIDPDHPLALLALGNLEYRAGNMEAARPLLERALKIGLTGGSKHTAARALAHVLDRLGETDGAIVWSAQAKRAPGELPRNFFDQAARYEAFIDACRTGLTGSVVSSWKFPSEVRADGREDPIFFVGFPRSGTTLLEQMLDAHPRFVASDEVLSLALVRETIVAQAGGEGAFPTRLTQLDASAIAALRRTYFNDMDGQVGADRLAGKRLVDKHPMNTPALSVVRRLFPQAKVLMSLRDPRDVCLSCYMTITSSPVGSTSFATLESTARAYASVINLWLHYREVLGLDWLEVRYEDTVQDSEATVRRVLDFLGEPWDDSVLKFTEKAKKKQFRSESYRQVTQGVYTRSLGRWVKYRDHFEKLDTILGPIIERLGYPHTRGS